jgi:hypothetical protein
MKRILAAVAILLSSLVTMASPASADGSSIAPTGTSVCLSLDASGGFANLRHIANCGPHGPYHIHVWSFGTDKNACDHTYNGTAFSCRVSVPNVIGGTQVCSELWYHLLGGGFEPWGLPCDPM